MTGVRARGEDIRKYIIEHVEKYPSDIGRRTSEHFKITRQAANSHLRRLTEEKILSETGQTRNKTYRLCPLSEDSYATPITPDLAEDVVWTDHIKPKLGQLPDNVMNIWHHGFTEMFNNAKDHSNGESIGVRIFRTAAETSMVIVDDGVGIFKKIKAALNLLDERHAILELSKGKFTTDPRNHTGEGIFFTSRMFDSFDILSWGIAYAHELGTPEDWIMDIQAGIGGTAVLMKLNNHTSRTTRKIFDLFTSGDEDASFSKTIVPVKLAKYGDDNLISRSQAKRLLARVELFRVVVLDFRDVPTIGQAFADEIFRVFAREHAEVELIPIRANSEIKRMIDRAKSASRTAPNFSQDETG